MTTLIDLERAVLQALEAAHDGVTEHDLLTQHHVSPYVLLTLLGRGLIRTRRQTMANPGGVVNLRFFLTNEGRAFISTDGVAKGA